MTSTTPWPDDTRLRDTEDRLRGKFAELFTFIGASPDLSRLQTPGLDACLSLDPARIEEEYERMRSTARAVGGDAEVTALLELMHSTKLDGWHGPAADAFRGRVSEIRTASLDQQQSILEGMLCLVAVQELAVQHRRSLLELMQATIAAIDEEMDQEAERTTKAVITISADLAKDLLSLDPTRLLTGSIATFIGLGRNVAEVVMNGGGRDEILAKFINTGTVVSAEFRSGLHAVRQKIESTRSERENLEFALDAPLPPQADVRSPEFRYEAFWCEDRTVDVFGPEVDKEREKYAAGMGAEDSEIGRRLGGWL